MLKKLSFLNCLSLCCLIVTTVFVILILIPNLYKIQNLFSFVSEEYISFYLFCLWQEKLPID